MALLTQFPSCIPLPPVSRLHLKLRKSPHRCNLPRLNNKRRAICYSNTPPWEPAPVTYASENEESFLTESSNNIFETMSSSSSSSKPDEASITKTKQHLDSQSTPSTPFKLLKQSLWVLGPVLLLITGVVPTLWLPVSSIFLGPNIASLLSLTGLDCIFNIGASLFLLMADSTARMNNICRSKPPSSYRFWNILANVTGFIVPLTMHIVSQKGLIEPQMPSISFAVVLGPYFLLLTVQMLTELLTWHWESPVWLVTPVVYEGYRLLQLMRGLKLGAELAAASWMMNTVRGLVCGWVVVLGLQLMRVAWYAGFTAAAYQQPPSDGVADG